MHRRLRLLSAALGLACTTSHAIAGVYTDDMSRCLVKSASPADQVVLVKWIFVALSLNASVAPLVTISAAERAADNRAAADLVSRLTLVDCRTETVAALKYEGQISLQSSFQVLGQTASRSLMNDTSVTGGLQDFAQYFDKRKWADLMQEAGIQPPAGSAPQAAH